MSIWFSLMAAAASDLLQAFYINDAMYRAVDASAWLAQIVPSVIDCIDFKFRIIMLL